MPQSIPKGLTREFILKALSDLDAGIDHPFGKPTGYELVHEGKRYAPKAVIGIALGIVAAKPDDNRIAGEAVRLRVLRLLPESPHFGGYRCPLIMLCRHREVLASCGTPI